MFIDVLFLLFGFIFLIKGADVMVDGASSIARKFGISTFVIGLTIVAFGTSAPELVVSALASLEGSSGIALGNIIGSNMSNTLLILGVASLIAPLLVKKATVNKEIPLSLLAIFAVGFMVNDFLIDHQLPNSLTRIDGLVLILFFVIFIYYTFGISKEDESVLSSAVEQLKGEATKEYGTMMSIVMIILGLTALGIGGQWIVNGAISIAKLFDLSETLIGLTIVAIGTSLPELAASAVAAYKGNTDIAVGNVVGSNIFNLLWVLGLSSVIRPITYDPIMNIDILMLIGVTILLLFLVYLGKKNILARREGAVLLALYFFYMVFLIIRG